jgi:uncharacterized protein (TIGR00375 family)
MVIADLHIHSRFSRATSSRLNPASLDRWARIKGLDLLGTGDCTHPAWLAELREQLEEAEEGFYFLKEDARSAFDRGPGLTEGLPKPAAKVLRFALTGEISTIYKRDGKTRKVHHLVILPDFKTAAAFSARLERVGNIVSDGRPILGIDSRDLLSMLLDSGEGALLIPAHIWTPWFSVLGAKSGFDSIEECYGDLSSLIPAVETGLSSNPSMNWALSSLDRFSIVSNSDAHSPDKLGREATILDMEFSFAAFRAALGSHGGNADRARVLGTIEFFPQEGKYHYAGHRDCGVCLGPEEAAREQGRCPVCGKALTEGVMGRVLELADRPVDENSPCPPEYGGTNRRPYHSLIPLKEILGEIVNTGPNSRKVNALYGGLIEKAGSEFSLLMDMSPGEIGGLRVPGVSGEILAEAIGRMRGGRVSVSPGYDGEYGVIRVFPAGKAPGDSSGQDLFGEFSGEFPEESAEENPAENHEKGKMRISKKGGTAGTAVPGPILPAGQDESLADESSGAFSAAEIFTLNPDQERAAAYEGSRVLVIAGPGTGKTALLAARIARLLAGGADPASILALSFTVKAAAELRERIIRIAGDDRAAGLTAATFHSLCSTLLREQGIPGDFRILDEGEREDLLRELCAAEAKDRGSGRAVRPRRLGAYIEERKRFLLLPGEKAPKPGAALILPPGGEIPAAVPRMETLYEQYRNRLRAEGLLDFEDLPAGLVRLLLARKDILVYYRSRYRHVFVDEYQDINFAQYVLIRFLAPPAEDTEEGQADKERRIRTLWVIGDPNQAIYGFRGSDKRFIDRFREDYPGAGRFELSKSFRCAAPIIGAAGRLVGAELVGSDPFRREDGAASLYRSEYATEKAEAEGIARSIAALVGGTGFFAIDSGAAGKGRKAGAGAGNAGTAAPGDCAVLFRAASLSSPVIKALKDHGIPFELNGERIWWEEEPVRSLLDQLRESRRNRNPSPGLKPEDEIRKTWETLNRQKEKPPRGRNSPGGKDAPEPVERLIRMAALFGNLQSLLDALAYSGPDELPGEMNREGVRLMTVHASKGLEFDHVFVPGLEEGILPFTLYDDPAEKTAAGSRLEEERRILYVAMTRARRGLYLSWARSRDFRGRSLAGGPSRFLGELEQLVPLAAEGRIKRDPQFRLF